MCTPGGSIGSASGVAAAIRWYDGWSATGVSAIAPITWLMV